MNGKRNKFGNGFDEFGRRIRLPKMGDTISIISILTLIFGIFGFVYILKKKKKKK